MVRRPLIAALGLVSLLAAFVFAAPAQSCCIGGHVYPPGYHPGDQPRPPLAIGDSVMLDAARPLAGRGFEVDARQGRFMYHVLRILRARRRAHSLPGLVVVGIGVNFPARYSEIRRALRLIRPGRVLALVTPKRSWRAIGEGPIREAARIHPDRVRVIDWVSYSAGHTDWFVSDGTHLTRPGVAAYTRLLASVLPRRR
jgi:hypothetical protein